MEKENYLLALCRCVVLNPLRAGVVKKPGGWNWSSHRAAALRKGPDYLTLEWNLGQLRSKRPVAPKKYRAFVREGIHGGTPWDELRGQVLMGQEGFIDRFKGLLEDKKGVKEVPRPQRYVGRPSLDKIFSERKAKGQRDIGANAAHMSYGYNLKEIANHLAIHYTTVSKVIGETRAGKK